MLHNPTGKERLALAFLLGMLAILGPLNIDMYLPSFPEIADRPDNQLADRKPDQTGC